MPKWICDDCGSHFPGGVEKCPKCEPEYVTYPTPIKTQTFASWFDSHNGHKLTFLTFGKYENVLIRCHYCNEYYLL